MGKIAPYGTWESPITASDVARAGGGPQRVGVHAGLPWWTESRPTEGGRVALLRAVLAGPGQAPVAEEVLGPPWNVRNRVHEYGGQPWAVLDTPRGTRVAFTHWADQRVYAVDPDDPAGEPWPISPEPQRRHGIRYSDLTPGAGGSEVWCVRETVTGDRPTDVRRDLVALSVTGIEVRVLAASHHFLTAPKPSPDGRHLAWIGWDHPAMPWDGTELCVAELTAGGIAGEHHVTGEHWAVGEHWVVAGGPREAVCQVEWAGNDELYVLTDPTGWWNLYRVGLDGSARNLAPTEAELGGPMWTLGSRWFAPLGDGRHAVVKAGRLAVLDEAAGTVRDVRAVLPDWRVWAAQLTTHGNTVYSVAGGPFRDGAVVRVDLDSGELTEITRQPAELPDRRYLPEPEEREFAGPNGAIPAFVYPPTNPDYAAAPDELPPFVVHAHGGPTGAFSPVLSLEVAYLTSRGIGVVAVNYGGSTGYGREFRERLRQSWGVVDVADCAAVAEALVAEGTADGQRLAIRGGSAGGWTTAASLTSVPTYRCGTSMFPILDLTGWTGAGGETHDFESQYLHSLIGPYPETADRYRDRSPASHVDRLAGPVLFLQGLEDEICPPVQVERFVEQLAGRGIPHAYLTFEGEQHGFRRAETIRTALESEVAFYGQVLGFTPAGVGPLELRS